MYKIQNFLQKQSQHFIAFYLGLAGFSTYFCMYAFRKPFTAADFQGITLWGVDYKIVLVIAQVLGYATAKGLGIKIVSEVLPQKRAKNILLMIAFAGVNLFFFAIVTPPYNCIFMFLNGLCLGMVYGLVFSFLEGREITEILGAGLAISFIVSSGIVKSIGKYFINRGINEYWMPFWTGLIFFPLLLISVYALSLAPKPTETDQKERSVRLPMNSVARKNFLKKYGFGLISLIIVYVLMTILRDVRDNFGVEIWREIGVVDASIFTKTESLIGLVICILTALMYFVKDHKTAFMLNHCMIFTGSLLVLISTISFQNHAINSFGWSVFLGIGLYMAYVPYNGMLFDRLLAVLKEKGNVGFLFYLADFSGYLATVIILIYQNFGNQQISWLNFLIDLAQILPIICTISITVSFFYFNQKFNSNFKIQLRNVKKIREHNF
ncbi:MAG: hypothetical protein H7339_04765 [Arcicella sp.]|nr:hypothetical protein [Arcicella sp.]